MSSGSFGFARVHSGARRVRKVNSISRGLIRGRVAFSGFIRDRNGLFSASRCSQVHSRSRGLLCSTYRVRVGSFRREKGRLLNLG